MIFDDRVETLVVLKIVKLGEGINKYSKSRDVIIGRSLIANPIIKSLITKKILLIITSKHSYFTLLYDNLITII